MKILALIPGLIGCASPLFAQAPTDIEVSPPEVRLTAGAAVQVAATGYSDSGDVVQGISFHWSNTDTTVLRIQADSGSDVVTLVALRPGAAVVEARAGQVRGFTTVEITGGTPGDRAGPSPETEEARRRIATCAGLLKLPVAGSWAQWQTPKGAIKLSLLGSEQREDSTLYRLEIATSTEQGAVVMRLLTSTWPNTSEGLVEVVVQARGRPPIRLPAERLAAMRSRGPGNPARAAASHCKAMTEVGVESMTVPAGTFQARHFHDAENNYQSWVDPEVPFALVKAVNPNGSEVILVATGTNATSGLTGPVTDMPAGPARSGRASGRRNP